MSERNSNLLVIAGIVLVLGVMTLLMEILTRRLDTRLKASPRSLAELQIRQLHYAAEAFRLDTGRYPHAAEGLGALLRAPAGLGESWKGPYLHKPDLPMDPWGAAYLYRPLADGRFEISSLGADRSPGGEGEDADLSNANIVAGAEPR
jgi:general secretion pathway protein G